MTLTETVRTGIQYRPTIPGLVPEIEERHAARHNGYTWRQWRKLDRRERADGVGVFRLDRLVDLHSNDAISQDSKRRRATAERRARK